MDSFRTFIAIELPQDLRARVRDHINRLRRELPEVSASWSRDDNLHLTLRFLGNVAVAELPNVSGAVERALNPGLPFELTISGCGVFSPRGRSSVLWIGAQASELHDLHDGIESELAAAGIPRESRPFHPHLTIARLRKPQDARCLAELHQSLGFATQVATVSEVVVFRSELLKEGSKHTAISRHALQ